MSRRTIPEIRLALYALSEAIKREPIDPPMIEMARREGWAAEIRKLADETKREYGTRPPARARVRITEAMETTIREIARHNPGWSQQQIANQVAVIHRLPTFSAGRVSETLNGKRGER
jgi:hypothetical protein